MIKKILPFLLALIFATPAFAQLTWDNNSAGWPPPPLPLPLGSSGTFLKSQGPGNPLIWAIPGGGGGGCPGCTANQIPFWTGAAFNTDGGNAYGAHGHVTLGDATHAGTLDLLDSSGNNVTHLNTGILTLGNTGAGNAGSINVYDGAGGNGTHITSAVISLGDGNLTGTLNVYDVFSGLAANITGPQLQLGNSNGVGTLAISDGTANFPATLTGSTLVLGNVGTPAVGVFQMFDSHGQSVTLGGGALSLGTTGSAGHVTVRDTSNNVDAEILNGTLTLGNTVAGTGGTLNLTDGGGNTITQVTNGLVVTGDTGTAGEFNTKDISGNSDTELMSGSLYLGNSTTPTAANIVMFGTTSGSVTLEVPAVVTGSPLFVLPGADGTNGQFIKTDGAGNLSFASGNSGTVTSFSAGNLSPLFTTSVATATTTPALSFTLSNAGAGTLFGNFSGSSGAPSFNAPGTTDYVLGVAHTGGGLEYKQLTTSGSGLSITPTAGVTTFANTGVTSNVAGTGIAVSGATGAVTVSVATNTANTLAGYSNTGVFSDVAIGTGLSLSGGTLSGTVVACSSCTSGQLTYYNGTNVTTDTGAAYAGNGSLTLGLSGHAGILNLDDSSGNIVTSFFVGTLTLGNTGVGNSGSINVYDGAGGNGTHITSANITLGDANLPGQLAITDTGGNINTTLTNANVLLGLAGHTTGSINLKGTTSGNVTFTTTAAAGTGSFTFNATDTTVNGSTSGTLDWIQTEQGTYEKKVVIGFTSYVDAGTTITYTTPFSFTPVITGNNTGLTISTISKTQVVIPASVSASGTVVIEGY